MFQITKEFSKTVKSLLDGSEAKRIGTYTLPQFGVQLADGAKMSEEQALEALQEAANYFGGEFISYLNRSIVQAAQRRANNDLRAGAAGLSAQDAAYVNLMLSMARQAAYAECGVPDAKGDIKVDKKSAEYRDAMASSLSFNLNKPKFAHLAPVFKVSGDSKVAFDFTAPGSLIAGDSDEETAETE